METGNDYPSQPERIFPERRKPFNNDYDVHISEIGYKTEYDLECKVKIIFKPLKDHLPEVDLSKFFYDSGLMDEGMNFESFPSGSEKDKFSASTKYGVVKVPYDSCFENPHDLWTIFHEAGHVIEGKKMMKENSAKYGRQVNSRLRTIAFGVSDSKQTREVVDDEILAWKKAMEIAKLFNENTGINPYGLFDSAEDFIKFVEPKLGSYWDILRENSAVKYKTLFEARTYAFLEKEFKANYKQVKE